MTENSDPPDLSDFEDQQEAFARGDLDSVAKYIRAVAEARAKRRAAAVEKLRSE